MAKAMTTRIGWADLPERVTTGIEKIIGGPVVEAVSQAGGFSPGTADRVRASDGTRAFVKAVAPYLNPDSPALHRREAAIAAALPAEVPAPRLRGSYDDGEWIALVFEDVEGRHPHTPWSAAELDDWIRINLGRLEAMAWRGVEALTGDRVVHRDICSDNLLIRPDGRVTIVDWP